MMNEDEEQIKSVLKWTYGKHESTLTLIHTEYIQVTCKINFQTTWSLLSNSAEMEFILCVRNSLLGYPWTDFDETLGVYRVDPKLVQRQISDFRCRPETGSGPVFRKPEVPIIETGSRKVSHRKARFYSERLLFVFHFSILEATMIILSGYVQDGNGSRKYDVVPV